MKYEIFISYSRRDYVDENENIIPGSPVKAVLDFLSENKISYWFDKEGIYSSKEYAKLIVEAIQDSRMMLFIHSQHSNQSIHTPREVAEAFNSNKPIVILKLDETAFGVNFRYYLNNLDYTEYSKVDAMPRLLNAIKKVQIEEEQKECERVKEADETKRQITGFANRVEELRGQKVGLLREVYSRLKCIAIETKQCPVCGSTQRINSEYCNTCGWYFHSLTSILVDGEELVAQRNKNQILIAQNRWNTKPVVAKLTLSQILLSNKPKLIAGIVGGLILFFGACYLFNYSEREQVKMLSASLQHQIDMSKHLTDTMQALIRDNFAQREMIEQKDSFIQTYLKEVTFNIPFPVGSARLTLDSENEMKLRNAINDVKSYDGTLVALEIENATSPEGSTIRNDELARARAKAFSELIKPYLGDVEINVVSKVHTWFDVADILRQQGHTKEADMIYALEGKSNDAIGCEVRKNIALYNLAKETFSQLRYTTCKFKMVHSSYAK